MLISHGIFAAASAVAIAVVDVVFILISRSNFFTFISSQNVSYLLHKKSEEKGIAICCGHKYEWLGKILGQYLLLYCMSM